MYQRKKRETIEGSQTDKYILAFTDTVGDINKFAGQAEKTLNTIIKAEENGFWGSFIKLFREISYQHISL